MSSISIVRKLQADSVNFDVPVSSLLRTAKIIATKLNLEDALTWIDRELNGYMEVPVKDLPLYRQLTGEPRAYNPYRGWQAMLFQHGETARFYSLAPLGQALGSIEAGLKGGKKGQLTMPYPPEVKARLVKSLEEPTDVTIFLDYSQLWGVVEAVRNLILNWSLELEKAGVVGENLAFTAEEKREAGPVSQQFFIQNVGVLGDVSDHAQVSNQQTAVAALDVGKLLDFVNQVRAAIPLLPNETRERVQPMLTQLEAEAAAPSADQSKLRALLASMKRICEEVTGNVVAQGIVALITSLI